MNRSSLTRFAWFSIAAAILTKRGHQLLERIEADIRHALPTAAVFTHLESLNDPASWDDMALDRAVAPPSLDLPQPA